MTTETAQGGAIRIDLKALLMFAATLAFFFISGACGLVYQVVWTRKLVLLFGTTSYAVSTVLSIFFLGLAIGSLWGGRLADRTQRPLLLYGVFEIIIGVWALAFILFIGFGEEVVVTALRAVAATRPMGVVLRGLLALAFLIVPVTLMGATLPLLARFVAGTARVRGLRIGLLYSVNTFGAVAGCAVAGFVLLAQHGYTRATFIGAAANVGVGILAVLLGARAKARMQPAVEVPATDAEPIDADEPSRRVTRALLAAFAVSGCCAIALEVLWTRLLVLVFLGTTYAFTTMLVAILCGIAVGSFAAAPFVDKRKHPVALFGAAEMLIGLTCLLVLPLFAGLPARFAEMRFEAGAAWEALIRAKFVLSFMTLFLPTFLFGAAFPLVVKAASSVRRLGRDVGRLYSWNTFGGVLGALLGGYILLPLLGAHNGIVLLGGTMMGVGAAIVLVAPRLGTAPKAAILVLALAGAAGAWLVMPANVGLAMNAAYVPDEEEVIHYDEGVEGTVVVTESPDAKDGHDRTLYINAMQATASIEQGVRMNRFQGVLPLLFDRDPDKVLFMCFGSGITAGTLSLSDFGGIDAVEISRDVLEAAPLFAADNFAVMENPKVTFIIDDGRNFLLTTTKKYDVITFEPMPLAQTGVSTFYTEEYYRLCREHLEEGGIVSQWVPLHSLSPEIVRSLVYTFTRAFDDYTMWFVNADLFLIGSNRPLVIDFPAAAKRLQAPALPEALTNAGFPDIYEVLSGFVMGKDNIDAYAEGGEVMSDDRPWAEFIAPKLIYQDTVAESLAELQPYLQGPAALTRFEGMDGTAAEEARASLARRVESKEVEFEGVRQMRGGLIGGGQEDWFTQALDIDPANASARFYLRQMMTTRADLFGRWEQFDEGIAYMRRMEQYFPEDPELALALADLFYGAGRHAEALETYQAYRARGGNDPRAEERIGELQGR